MLGCIAYLMHFQVLEFHQCILFGSENFMNQITSVCIVFRQGQMTASQPWRIAGLLQGEHSLKVNSELCIPVLQMKHNF